MTVTVELPQEVFGTRAGPFTLTPYTAIASSAFAPSQPLYGPIRERLWTFWMDSQPMSRAQTIEMEAFFARIAGDDWAFTAWDPLRQLPLGAGAGFAPTNSEILFTTSPGGQDLSLCTDFKLLEGSTTVLVKEAAARGATTLLLKGFPPALAGQAALKRGDHFSVGLPGEMNLHMAMGNAVIDANGETRVEFLAPLWKRALVNDLVEFRRPTGRFGLYAKENGTVELVRSAGPLASGRLTAIEYPYQEQQE